MPEQAYESKEPMWKAENLEKNFQWLFSAQGAKVLLKESMRKLNACSSCVDKHHLLSGNFLSRPGSLLLEHGKTAPSTGPKLSAGGPARAILSRSDTFLVPS